MSTNVTLNYTGGRQWYRIPDSVPAVDIAYHIVGGGGGAGGNDSHHGGDGGGASVAKGSLRLTGGDLIEVFVGQGGTHGSSGSAYGHGTGGASMSGYAGGDGANPGPSGWSGGGGGGGGATVIRVNGVVKAVGGGGAGGGGGGNHSYGVNAANTYGAFNPGDSYTLPRQYLGYAWCQFLNDYGVWHKSGAGADTTTYYVNFPVTGDYTFQISVDNYGYMEIDGERVAEISSYGTYNTTTATIGAGMRAVKFYAENWGGPAGFSGRITRNGTEIWTTRYPTQPIVYSNGLAAPRTYGDEGGGGGGGGGYLGGVGGDRGYGDNGGKPGTLGKAFGDTALAGQYSNQRWSAYPISNGDGGALGSSPENGVNGQAALTFNISNRDIWNKVAGKWKNCKEAFVKVNGVWKKSSEVYVKRNGVWKKSLTHGGSIVPVFNSDSVDWNGSLTPLTAAPPTTKSFTSYIAGIHAGGCGPAIAYGTLPTNNGSKVFAGRAPLIKTFTPYNTTVKPTNTIAFRGANVTDADLAKFGITDGFSNIPVVRPGQKLHWGFDLWCDHGWTFGFYHWNAKTTFSGPNPQAADYWDVYTADFGASGRQHPVASGDFIIPSTFSADEVLVVAWGDRRTGCPTGLSYLTIDISYKTY